jgi:hypothetical protein
MEIEGDKPWDIKTVKISLGNEWDENGWLETEVFDDKTFRITFSGADMRWNTEDRSDCTVEDMPLSVARRLRDFLNYAVPKDASDKTA